ncbi:RDD family protein [Streptomyces sp. NPDC059740]|uniref:RDD family protein n=1 Tax=Streptomyces sp. NPDC059740 TaxID=3346926 RepID=UPI0036688492
MSAPTPGAAGAPAPGYYPDPSIPGYIRYWNGSSWEPGTSRPAAADGETPAPPANAGAPADTPAGAGAPAAAVTDTGPVFFDDESASAAQTTPPALDGPTPGWHADPARQGGLADGGRLSWGAEQSAGAGQAQQAGVPTPRGQGGAAPEGQAPAAESGPTPPADRGPRHEGTVAIRAVRSGGAKPSGEGGSTPAGSTPAGSTPGDSAPAQSGPAPTPGTPPPAHNSTMAIRVPRPQSGPGAQVPPQAAPQGPSTPQGAPPAQGAQPAPAVPPQANPGPAGPQGPTGPGPAGPQVGGFPPGAFPQQTALPPDAFVPEPFAAGGAAPEGGPAAEGVMPWKPPVENPFAFAEATPGRPAALGRRFAARLLDSVVLGAVVGAVAFPLGSLGADHIADKVAAAKQSGRLTTVYLLDGTTGGYLAVVLAVLLVGGLLYEALPTAKWGVTLGKRLCGVRVLDIEDHETPTFASAARRWLVYGVLGAVAVGVVNAAWCLFDKPWRQCWHDKVARTFVAERESD